MLPTGSADAAQPGQDSAQYDPNAEDAVAGGPDAVWTPTRFDIDGSRKYAVLFFYCNTSKGGDAVCDCMLMRRTTFPNARLSEFLPNFEWYQMDTDSADAAPFVGRYGVRTSPTFIVVDQAGQELWRVSGHKQAGELASSLQNLLSGMSRVAQRHERMISQLTERLAAAHTALQAGDFKQSLRALQWIERAARGSGYAQWLDESERGLAFLRGRLERVLADLERRAGTDSEGVAAAAREFRKNYGLAFPDLGRRADALVGR